jgi:hypothetical protein
LILNRLSSAAAIHHLKRLGDALQIGRPKPAATSAAAATPAFIAKPVEPRSMLCVLNQVGTLSQASTNAPAGIHRSGVA